MDRNMDRITLIEYRPERAQFRALQVRNAAHATMGYRQDGADYFFPEEAVWLTEVGSGAVLHTGKVLSVQQCHSLLAQLCISPERYLVYSYLKRCGLIVFPFGTLRPPQLPQVSAASTLPNLSYRTCQMSFPQGSDNAVFVGIASSSIPEASTTRVPYRFPAKLLDQFPNYSKKKLTLHKLHEKPEIAKQFGLIGTSQLAKFGSSIDPKVLEPNAREIGARRHAREILRPQYWPRFDEFASHVQCWQEYRERRAKCLEQQQRQQAHISRPMAVAKRKTTVKPLNISPQMLDYDVYAPDPTFSRTLGPEPKFRLIVVGHNFKLAPSIEHLHRLSEQLIGGQLLVAFVHHNIVLFYDINYMPIPIPQFL